MSNHIAIGILIRDIKIAIQGFKYVSEIIDEKGYKSWKEKLTDFPDISTYLYDPNQPYNILTALAVMSTAIGDGMVSPTREHCFSLFAKLDYWLLKFDQLINEKKFREKIKNLEGFNFLGTFSELSLASVFETHGFQVDFETKFRHEVTDKKRDVDISVIDKDGFKTHIEIYMPHHKYGNHLQLRGTTTIVAVRPYPICRSTV